MENIFGVFQLFLLVVLIVLVIWQILRSIPGERLEAAPQQTGDGLQSIHLQPERSIYDYSAALEGIFNIVAHPEELADAEPFKQGVAYICSPWMTPGDVLRLATGDNMLVSCMAMQALSQRMDCRDAWTEILNGIGTYSPYSQYFGLKFLMTATPDSEAIISRVLSRTTHYMDSRLSRACIEDLIRKRYEVGENLSLDPAEISVLNEEGRHALRRFLNGIDLALGKPLLDTMGDIPDDFGQSDILMRAGRLWEAKDAESARRLVSHLAAEKAVSEIKSLLVAPQPQSVLLTGESGVGKTTIQRMLAGELFEQGWTIFVAGHNDLLAGQMYVGQLEQRLKQIIERLRANGKTIWFIPDIDRLAYTGKHAHSDYSALDAIIPHIVDGTLRIVASVQPAALDRLLQFQPRIATGMAAFELKPTSRETTLDIAGRWMKQTLGYRDQELLGNVLDLTQQYLSDRSTPGSVMDLLKSTVLRLSGGEAGGQTTIGLDDVIATLAHQTGLPLGLLDPDRDLDLDGLKGTLSSRVIGQDEAVDCLVDRVAMMKAGLADPTRPFGVFLFAGPTGTGKTEIAKSLAGWLFGSPDRMIRLDMSELQTSQSLDRLLGNPENQNSESLADQVRRQPFSVVLLDEFEKAHPNVWDLFLQVFDDARLTDRRGRTTSFRHTIIILTANLGATIPTGQSIGFSPKQDVFDEDVVIQAVENAFRREFVNRLDRVVVFRPLDKSMMRQILHRELDLAFNRRGLKARPWAVEWDESAVAFLLEKGFTPDLGARPLKRAVEQYLLSPLAATIVRHQVPEGDQFLFISCRGEEMTVEFVDPSAGETGEIAEPAEPDEKSEEVSVREILLHPGGSTGELEILRQQLIRLDANVTSDAWQLSKNARFSKMEEPDFWETPVRFPVLGQLEYIDRIEKGLERSRALLVRIEKAEKDHRLPRRLVAMLAQNIHLLTTACDDIEQDRPRESFFCVEAMAPTGHDRKSAVQFAARIAEMYENWAKARNMRLSHLFRTPPRNEMEMRAVFAVSGYGAYSLLAPEHGLHILEYPHDGASSHRRDSVQVIVAPQPDTPFPTSRKTALSAADEAIAPVRQSTPDVVRRYREEPSPLVRDSVRGWRTGRIDLVFAGNFDLF